MDNLIVSEEKQHVLTITLNRTDKKNALSANMYRELSQLLVNASKQSSVHCVLLRGDQNCFSAGNDLEDFMQNPDDLAALDFITALSQFDKPLVAAVAGAAVGIGTTMLLHCDMVIAATNSKFKLPFAQLGLCPEGGSSLLLPMKIGHNRAFELLVLGDTFSAEQALQYGLINKVCTADEVLTLANEAALRIAKLPHDAVMTSRHLLKAHTVKTLAHVMTNEAEQFSRLVKTEQCQGILARFFK